MKRAAYIIVQSGDDAPCVAILGVNFNHDVLGSDRVRLRLVQQQLADSVNDVRQRGVVGKA